jgi:hypothetical protein
VIHFTSSRFWKCYEDLPEDIQVLADKQFSLLKKDPSHPSLHFKKVGKYWSARVNADMRALALESGNDLVWFWIGAHGQYERIIRKG